MKSELLMTFENVQTLGPGRPSPGGPLMPGGPLGPTVPCKKLKKYLKKVWLVNCKNNEDHKMIQMQHKQKQQQKFS